MEKQAPEVDHEELSVQPAFGEKDFEPQTQQDAAIDLERDEELRPAVPNTRVGTRTGGTGGTEERPSRWRRLLVIIGMLVVFWLISSIRSAQKAPPKIVHASRYVQLLGYLDTNKLSHSLSFNRYSKEYKFRPAASPIITEQLKDGRTRIRGAEPTFRADERAASPTARPTAKAKVNGKGKGKGKVKTKTALQRK